MQEGLIPTFLPWGRCYPTWNICSSFLPTHAQLLTGSSNTNLGSVFPCTRITVPDTAGIVCYPHESTVLFFMASGSQFCFHIHSFLWGQLLEKGDLISILLPQEGEACILIVYSDPILLPSLG